MRTAIIIAFLCMVSLCKADTWYTVITDTNGAAVSTMRISIAGSHVLQPGEYPENYVWPTAKYRYWKKVGNDWVEMTAGEKNAVDDARKDKANNDADDDAFMDALLDVIADQQGITRNQLKQNIKAKIKANKLKDK